MLYNIAFFIFSLVYLPVLIFKGKLHKDFAQRFGSYDEATRRALEAPGQSIWIEAVSVGEVALCRTLIPQIKNLFPGTKIVLSTITKTGNDLARRLFANDAVVVYFPLDFSGTVRKAVDLIRPRLYIMVETEIWPGVLKELDKRRVPSIVVNGRISDRSFGKYMAARWFLGPTLGSISFFCMQSKTDLERIIAIGAPRGRVRLAGNIKFDIDVPVVATRSAYPWLGSGVELLVAGSTHEGEEEIVAQVYKDIVGLFPKLRLLIAPRHVNRVSDVEKTVRSLGFEPVRVSTITGQRPQNPYSHTQIFILDTIGHLNDFYALAKLVYVGGSLTKDGGHNPIEPALFEKPVVFGPHMFNFRDIAAIFLRGDGAIQAKDGADLRKVCERILADSQMAEMLGKNAKRIVAENGGATRNHLDAIKEVIASHG